MDIVGISPDEQVLSLSMLINRRFPLSINKINRDGAICRMLYSVWWLQFYILETLTS